MCKACEKISENMYIMGNEPSLACFRIQEHCHKSVPQLIDKMVIYSNRCSNCLIRLLPVERHEKSSGQTQRKLL